MNSERTLRVINHEHDRTCTHLMAVVWMGAFAVIAAGLLAIAITPPTRDLTLHVVDKERACSPSGDHECRYLIHAREGTFENTDSLFVGKFDSSDIYAEIKEGRAYTAHVRGWRNHTLSTYENIISVKEK